MDHRIDPTTLDRHVIRVGAGEPMLLLHGVGHRKEAWDRMLPLLAADFDVAAVDLPGFGGSQPLPVPQTEQAQAEWCAALMDALGWERAHVVGNSMGGHIAIRLGAMGRALTVTGISPGGMDQGWETTWAKSVLHLVERSAPFAPRLRPLLRTGLGRRALLSVMFGQPGSLAAVDAIDAAESPGSATAFGETIDVLGQVETDVTVDVPVTIAWGTRDRLLLPRQAERWLRQLPDARLVKLQGLGHLPMAEDPELVSDVVRRTARGASLPEDTAASA